MSTRLAALGLAAAFVAATSFTPMPGSAAPLVVLDTPAHASDVQSVDYKRRYWRHRNSDVHVRAPFTSVDTSRDTWVAAPFARVYSGSYGTYVRAPFVDLWVPR